MNNESDLTIEDVSTYDYPVPVVDCEPLPFIVL
jgi:hypothetical protein